jgi:outer membrane protein assembly factor BamB
LLLFLGALPSRADDWPQWLGPQRDSVWRESGIVERLPASGPPVRWRTPVGGGYAGPAVAAGRVYLTDRRLHKEARNPSNPFGRGVIPGLERVLCLNEADGKILWIHEYESLYTISYAAGPRATPLVHEGKVYTLGAEGQLFCLDTASGKVRWAHDFKQEYGIPAPVWGFAGHPLIHGDKLICLAGGEGATVVAFDRETGRELWRALRAKEPGYAPPTIIRLGEEPWLILWHPESVNALDPDTGKVHWSFPFNVRSGLSIATPRLQGQGLFTSAFYDGSLMLRLDGGQPEVVWRSKKSSERDTDALHCLMSTPFLEDGYIYGVCSYGQLRCLRADTGERVWETLAATTGGAQTRWGNAFLVKQGRRFILFNEKGDLIFAKLTPNGYEEVSRAHLLAPTNHDPGRAVVWSHPAFANRCLYARNDQEIMCVSLAAAPAGSQ